MHVHFFSLLSKKMSAVCKNFVDSYCYIRNFDTIKDCKIENVVAA